MHLLTRKSSEFDSAFKRRGVKDAAKLRANEKTDECVKARGRIYGFQRRDGKVEDVSVKNENASPVAGDDYL